MEPSTFDRLTRLFGTERSRRGVLKALAGGAIGAMAAGSRGESEAAAKRSVGNSCNVNADCASGLCVQESRGRKICHCQSPADCPASSRACTAVTCTAGACVAAAVGGIGALCALPRFYSVDPPGFPGVGCCAGLVCQGVSYPETEPGTGACGVNRPPVAVGESYVLSWMTTCHTLTLMGYDPDNDALLIEIVTPPTNGFISTFVDSRPAASYGDAAPGVRAMIAADASNFTCLDGSTPPQPNDGKGDANNGPVDWATNNQPEYQCPEGTYTLHYTCYAPFSPTFTGTDSFTYKATDVFGASSAPALVTITISETGDLG